MRVAILGSGSAGNSLVVESGGRRILIDAGFSCREIERRCERRGIDAASLQAVVVTHEHSDHVRGADRLARRHGLKVYATEGTLAASRWTAEAKRQLVPIASGWPYEVGGFSVEAFSVPHDASDPVGLVVEDDAGCRMGLASDLGSWGPLAATRLSELDVLLLETNHDLEMLRTGPYPWALKQRVAGMHGHLSNQQAAEGLPQVIGDRLQWVVLYHLSRTNNLPSLAAAGVVEALDRAGSSAEVRVSEQSRPSPWLEVA
jgi:phosphoribosyl 1,2-cyclic phosphodiesterase